MTTEDQRAATATILCPEPLELGEGPRYDPATDTAWWFDIIGKALYEHRFAGAETIRHDLPMMASAVAPIDAERQLLAAEDGLYIRDVSTGALALHLPLEADDPSTRSNDGAVHPSGALWISTMGKHAEPGAGAIHHAFRGEIRTLFPNLTIPNAISFTRDGRFAHFVDTAVGRLKRVRTDPATGLPSGEPEILVDGCAGGGSFDGAVVDRDGTLWVAIWAGGRIESYSASGQKTAALTIPARQPTCPAFVGRSADRLMVTSAREGMDATERRQDPDGGKVFLLDVAVKGWFAPPVAIA
ncbi:sugar lactone lactonase YvrE [Amorphus suaedae]